MALEVDHVFICCSPGAPEAEALVRLGLREGSPNTHPGQGTANRRFFFDNAFLELLWVSDPVEALSAQTRPTRLWERWSLRASGGCPFGIVFRSIGAQTVSPPFATWSYHPNYLPSGLAIEFAEGTSLEEPELIYLPFVHRSGPPANEPTDHALPLQQLCGVTVELPSAESLSQPSEVAQSAGLVTYCLAPAYVLELNFVAAKEIMFDLRPTLPLRFRGVAPQLPSLPIE
jgi:Glyoxalase-like domain